MSIAAVVRALIDAKATPEMILAAVEAIEKEREEKKAKKIPWQECIKLIHERDNYTCTYCGRQGVKFHIDHIVPRSQGGEDVLENLALACAPCNHSKGGRTPEQWEAKNGRHS